MSNITDSDATRHLPFGPGGTLLHFGRIVAVDIVRFDCAEPAVELPGMAAGMVAVDLRVASSPMCAMVRDARGVVFEPTGEVGSVTSTRLVPVDDLAPAVLDEAAFERAARALADAISSEVTP